MYGYDASLLTLSVGSGLGRCVCQVVLVCLMSPLYHTLHWAFRHRGGLTWCRGADEGHVCVCSLAGY